MLGLHLLILTAPQRALLLPFLRARKLFTERNLLQEKQTLSLTSEKELEI